MKTNVLKASLGGVCLAALLFAAGSASAVPINITVDASGNLLNGIGLANKVEYGQGNNNPSSNLAFLNAAIGNWNGVPLSPLMLAAGSYEVGPSDDNLGDVSSYTGALGYQYVVFHWGAGNAGGNGWWAAYYLGGDSISFNVLPQVGGQNVGGFSSARYFGQVREVPDGGATIALLGFALVGVDQLRRRIVKA